MSRFVHDTRVFPRIKIERNRTAEQVYKDLTEGRTIEVPLRVANLFPVCHSDEVDVVFLYLMHEMDPEQILKVYEVEGLSPDPLAQAAVNKTRPWLSDDNHGMWNRTVWQRGKRYWSLGIGTGWVEGAPGIPYIQLRKHVDRWDFPNKDGYWIVGSRLAK
ncbi:MAG: hypothetical protein HY505_00770 [Candidatus Yanofskybacteria bacterium]|nr:hypothetical protein [Candidatus Yanofskybacteria bacterium]